MDESIDSLADQAYEAVREEILRGRLRPGAALSRRRLAEQMGMSLVPVAEALRRLEDDRLVESRARAGTRVRVHTAEDVRQLYELREALETHRRGCSHARETAVGRHELRRLAEQLGLFSAPREQRRREFALRGAHASSSSTVGSRSTRAARS